MNEINGDSSDINKVAVEEKQAVSIQLTEEVSIEKESDSDVWLAYSDDYDEVILLESSEFHLTKGEVVDLFGKYDLSYEEFENIKKMVEGIV